MGILLAKSVRRLTSTQAFGLVSRNVCSVNCRLLGLLVLVIAVTGCNNGRQLQTDLYQRELRLQEDKIYQLQDCVEEYQAIIRGYRMEVAELKMSDGSAASKSKSSKSTQLKSINNTSSKIAPLGMPIEGSQESNMAPAELEFRSPDDTTPALDEAPMFNGEAPLFEPGNTEVLPLPDNTSGKAAAETISETMDEAPLFVPQSYDDNDSESPLTILSEADFSEATHSEAGSSDLSQQETSTELEEIIGSDLAHDDTPPMPGTPVKELKSLGRGLVLSPREEIGLVLRNGSPAPSGSPTLVAKVHFFSESFDLTNFNGEISLMLAEQKTVGSPNRLARWDFTSGEVRQAWNLQKQKPTRLVSQNTSNHKTIDLPLLLPNRLPSHRTLDMWIRIIEPTGKKRLTKIDAEFLADPLRLINVEPLASNALETKGVTQPKAQQEKLTTEHPVSTPSANKPAVRLVAENQWRRARADRLETISSDVVLATYEED